MASTTKDYLNTLKYGLMIIIVLLCIYIWFFETENFCVEATGQVDVEDEGKKCFKTIGESNEYKLYLIDKYHINQEPQFGNYTFNIS